MAEMATREVLMDYFVPYLEALRMPHGWGK
jgi:hypothetical protein